MPGWLAGWLDRRLAGLRRRNVSVPNGSRTPLATSHSMPRLAGWLDGWLAGLLAGWLAGWLAGMEFSTLDALERSAD